MILKSINLKNFRNYDNQKLTLNPKINIFIGKNAQGKTNILESIYDLAITKSHRTFIDSNLIKNGTKFFKITGEVKLERIKETKNLEIIVNNKGKKVSINNCVIKRISDYISQFNVILFSPDDLEIIKGSPSVRRKFLNIELGQLSNKYVIYLNDYNNLLKNRNEYLKKINIDNYDHEYLSIITNQLATRAIEIYKARKRFIDDLNLCIDKIYKKIFGGRNNIHLKYETSIILDSEDTNELKKKLIDKYGHVLQKEIAFAQTFVGPHRDNFIFYSGDKEVSDFGSQGQQRLVVLCLKLAEIGIFFREKKEYPVLLLDDIFSELDNHKKNKIIKYIDSKMQIFITTTDINNINSEMLKNATVFSVKNAKVTKKRRGDLND